MCRLIKTDRKVHFAVFMHEKALPITLKEFHKPYYVVRESDLDVCHSQLPYDILMSLIDLIDVLPLVHEF